MEQKTVIQPKPAEKPSIDLVWAVNGFHGTPDGKRIKMEIGKPVKGVGDQEFRTMMANGLIKENK